MKYLKIILWIGVFTGFMYAIIGLQNSSKQERIIQKIKTQSTIDSLQNIIDSLQLQVDTIQYESIDTTVIHWPWVERNFIISNIQISIKKHKIGLVLLKENYFQP